MNQEAPQMVVTIGESLGGRPPNVTVENTKFYGRPNFNGDMNQFKDDTRQMTIKLPDEAVEPLRALGYNVKTKVLEPEEIAEGKEAPNFLKVTVDVKNEGMPSERVPDIWVFLGENREKLTSKTMGIIDRSRFTNVDIEFRGWEYRPDEEPGKLSARLVQFVGVMEPNILGQKYGGLM